MKYYVKLDNNNVDTNLEYTIVDSILNININQSGDIEIIATDYQNKICLVIDKNLKVNITKYLNSSSKLDFDYDIKDNSYVNEFVIMEDDDLKINYYKNVSVLKDSTYEVSNAFFNDSSINCNVEINLNGINARALHNVAVIARRNDSKVLNVTINNNERITYGELNNFGVVKDQAKLIFNGTGFIKKGAKQSQAHQESKIITFDPKILAEANPYLIIDEADVEASHAAAVGKMDEEQLYYIQSRGINFENASKLITYGYLKPILNKISDERLKEKLEKLIEAKVVL